MSILQSVQNAEAKAEALREDARAKAKVVLEENRIHAEMAVKEFETAAEASRQEADRKARLDLETRRKDLSARTQAEEKAIVEAAEQRLPDAVAFLVKKAVGS